MRKPGSQGAMMGSKTNDVFNTEVVMILEDNGRIIVQICKITNRQRVMIPESMEDLDSLAISK